MSNYAATKIMGEELFKAYNQKYKLTQNKQSNNDFSKYLKKKTEYES